MSSLANVKAIWTDGKLQFQNAADGTAIFTVDGPNATLTVNGTFSPSVTSVSNFTVTGTLTVATTTGTGYVVMTDNLASAFAFKEGSNSYLTFVTTNSSESVSVGQNLTIADAKNIIVGTSTGTVIGTGTTQKLGFYGATPIAQRSGSAQAAVTTTVGSAVAGTAATNSSPYGYAQAQADAIVANINDLRTDVLAITTLVNELRAAAVALGTIKGSS